MKLPTVEEQVCSFEQAEKLKSLGLILSTLYAFVDSILVPVDKLLEGKQILPAYTVAELGVLLGYRLFDQHFIDEKWSVTVEYFKDEKLVDGKMITADTEAQARADAFIWLIENDYLKVEDL